MATRFNEADDDLWFFTTASAAKTREIEKDRQVSIAYADVKRHSMLRFPAALHSSVINR